MNSSPSRLIPPSARFETTGEGVQVQFAVPTDLLFCQGHFPGNPLVPGALLANWMWETAAQITREPLRQLRSMKFRAPVQPGDVVIIEATPSPDAVQVALRVGERLCADGVFFA